MQNKCIICNKPIDEGRQVCHKCEAMVYNNYPIIILMGKSASGKDAILNALVNDYYYNPVITTTTRPMREHEINGKDYFFTTKDNFAKEVCNNNFIEFRSYNTLVNNKKDVWFYGLHKFNNNIDYNKTNVLILDYNGAVKAIKHFGSNKCKVVYIDTKDSIRTKRAKQRGSFDKTEWNRRKKSDKQDFKWSQIKNIVNLRIRNNNTTIDEICKKIVDKFEVI